MEALEQVVDFFQASTLGMDFSTEVFVEHTAEMVGLLAEDDMKGCKAKQEVQTRMEEWGCTKVAWVHSDCCNSKSKVHLAYLVDMVKGLEAFSG